ncbi:hypothetical protein [Cesiribacter andamanensis]|nr:hypothetical protein [Cesiribacter andamanensis]
MPPDWPAVQGAERFADVWSDETSNYMGGQQHQRIGVAGLKTPA